MSVRASLHDFDWNRSLILLTLLHLLYYMAIIILTTVVTNWQPIWFVFPVLNLVVFFLFDSKSNNEEKNESSDRGILRRIIIALTVAMTITMTLASLGPIVVAYGVLAALILDLILTTVF
ncbi:MAG: membrane protein of unknown function [Candidatus Thorarchaeota archaeon]|nr:MAG: membrane protein of unknown function [Candidatus Thorarchaeota archaeon]